MNHDSAAMSNAIMLVHLVILALSVVTLGLVAYVAHVVRQFIHLSILFERANPSKPARRVEQRAGAGAN